MRKIAISFAAIIGLTACASTGPVQIGSDTYMISKQSAGGLFVQPASIRAEIIREATVFCSSSGKVFQLNSFHDQGAIPGRNMPSSEINFMCLNKNDPDIARLEMKKIQMQ